MTSSTLHKISLLATASLMAVSCLVNKEVGYDPDVELNLLPCLGELVRAPQDEEFAFPSDESFGLSLWQFPSGKDWAEVSSPYVDMKEVCYDNRWSFEGMSYWPQKTFSLAALAYAPFGEASRVNAVEGVVYQNFDTSRNQIDILYTTLQTGLDKFTSGGTIVLPFNHALSRIGVRLITANPEALDMVVKKVSIEPVAHKGTFRSLSSPQWTLAEDRTELVFFEGDTRPSYEAVLIGESFYLPEQRLDMGIKVEALHRTASGELYPVSLVTEPLSITIEQGRQYIFTLSASLNAAKVIETTVIQQFYKR